MSYLRRNPTPLTCESLEGRDCPAGRIFAFAGYVAVVGDSGANTVAVTDDGAGNVSVTIDGTTKALTGVKAVAVYTDSGDDTVTYDITGALSTSRAIAVSTGPGADAVTVTAGGVAAHVALGIAVDGGRDADTVSVEVDAGSSTGTVATAVSGGAGDDDLTLNVTGDARVLAVMNGGPGTDTGVATDNVTKISIEA